MMQVDLVLIIIFGAFYTIHIRGFFPLGGGHPQHGEAGYRSGEGARGGSPGGFPRVSAGRSSHRSAGCHVPRPIPRDGQGEKEAAPGSRGHAAVGLNRPPEAAHSGSGPSSCAAASTWPSPQVIVYNKVY